MNTPDLALRDLEAVAAVASHGHFGRAADALRVAQPTLSVQVQKVERALGVRLFERAGRRFFITPAGERLIPIVRELLGQAQRLRETAARDEDAASSEPLRIGVIPTLGPYLMPYLLLPARRGSDGRRLRISEAQTARLLEHLRDGSLDAALVTLPIRNETLACVPLFDEPFRVIAPRGSDILACERLSPARLSARDMILLEEGHCLREQTLRLCGRRGGSTPRLMTTSLETLKYLVAAGEGYSLLPFLASDLSPRIAKLVELRPFDERSPSRRVGLVFRPTSPRRQELLALADAIRSACPVGVVPVSDTAPRTKPARRGTQ